MSHLAVKHREIDVAQFVVRTDALSYPVDWHRGRSATLDLSEFGLGPARHACRHTEMSDTQVSNDNRSSLVSSFSVAPFSPSNALS